MLVAQALAMKLYHEGHYNGLIGPAPNIACVYPKSEKPEDYLAAEYMSAFRNWLFLDAAVYGKYNHLAWRLLKALSATPDIEEGDMELMRDNTADFIAFNYYKKLGAKGIRLDVGFTGREEAQMTRNEEDLTIEINMSNDDHYLERIFDYQPNRTQLVGCHNFFPQAYTGLSTDFFLACSERFREKGLRTAAFVTSQEGNIGPWPLHEDYVR